MIWLLEKRTKLPWETLTELLCGLEPGLTLLAARPSRGKTTMEDQVALWTAAKGLKVGRITLDSTREELLQRAMCRKAGVSLPKLKWGYAGRSQLAAVREAKDLLQDYGMMFDDTSREIRQICTRARAWKMRHGLDLLTVDYVQLIDASEMGYRASDANARVGYVSKTLKGLALELRVPVLALSQLNRAVEKEGREPQLSDLRDSGSLEQDAAKVLFTAKARKVEEFKQLRPVWVDVAKNQDGETGKLEFWLYPHYFRFERAQNDFEDLEEMKASLGL